MSTIVEIEKLALDLSERERATLAADLLDSLPPVLSDEDEGIAEALSRDAEINADPTQTISLAELDSQQRAEQLKRVMREYLEADRQFTLARNTIFRAMVKNNIGNVLRELARFREAHEYLDEARRLAVRLRDKVRTAQVDQTRVEVMIEQRRFREAERIARGAAASFEKAGRRCLLVEALINRGLALARLGKKEQAQFTLQRAIEVAQQVNALSLAGRAALTLTEEIDDLSIQALATAYDWANEWLADTQSADLLRRISKAASKLLARLQVEFITEDVADVLTNNG